MQKNKKIIVALVCLILIVIAGGTYAAIVTSTDRIENVTTSRLGIQLIQGNTGEKEGITYKNQDGVLGLNYGSAIPGETIEETMAVKVDDDSKESYIRVTVNRYWLDQNGQKSVADVNDEDYLDPEAIVIHTNNTSHWIIQEDSSDPETIYYYYKLPVNTGDTTDNLMDNFTVLPHLVGNTNAYSGYASQIDFFAEGVQTIAGQDALLAEWGVNVTLDENGKIMQILEQ